jgi:hypothetical protein
MKINIPILIVLSAVSCSSLTSYNSQIDPAYASYRSGDTASAAEAALDLATEHDGENDSLVFTLEAGSMLRDAARYEESTIELNAAEYFIKEDFDLRATLDPKDMLETIGAYGVSSKALSYKGYVADRIMINTMKALNYIAIGDIEGAATETRRLVSAQEDGEKLYAEDSDLTRQSSAEGMSGKGATIDVLGFGQDFVDETGKPFRELFSGLYIDTRMDGFKFPFSTFVSGLVGRLAPEVGGDPQYDFDALAASNPKNSVIADEKAAIDNGDSADGWAYVIFENGVAPRKVSVEMPIPVGYMRALFSPDSNLGDYFSVSYMSLPSLTRGKLAAEDGLFLEGANGLALTTEVISDMSQVMAYEYQQTWPSMLCREITAFILKTFALEMGGDLVEGELNNQLGDSALAQEGASFLTSWMQSSASKALSQADDRNWRSLARQYEIGRFNLEGQSSITLSLVGHPANTMTVELPEGAKNVVIQVRSINPEHMTAVVSGF